MSINFWRYVKYTDDGASVYQCLHCYKEWEARTSPGYTDKEEYTPNWKFCPYCGIQWQKEKCWDEEKKQERIIYGKFEIDYTLIVQERTFWEDRDQSEWKDEKRIELSSNCGNRHYPYHRKPINDIFDCYKRACYSARKNYFWENSQNQVRVICRKANCLDKVILFYSHGPSERVFELDNDDSDDE
jgi:hypothetical protein